MSVHRERFLSKSRRLPPLVSPSKTLCYRSCASTRCVLISQQRFLSSTSSKHAPDSFPSSFPLIPLLLSLSSLMSSVSPRPPSQDELCLSGQCCCTMLFYSGRQLSQRGLDRGSCSSQQQPSPTTFKSVHTAHHPLNGTHSCLCTNTYRYPLSIFSFFIFFL